MSQTVRVDDINDQIDETVHIAACGYRAPFALISLATCLLLFDSLLPACPELPDSRRGLFAS